MNGREGVFPSTLVGATSRPHRRSQEWRTGTSHQSVSLSMLSTDDGCERSISHCLAEGRYCNIQVWFLCLPDNWSVWNLPPATQTSCDLTSSFLSSAMLYQERRLRLERAIACFLCFNFLVLPDFRFSQSLPALSLNQRPPCSIDPKRHPWILFLSLQLSAHGFSVPSQITKCKGWDRGFCTSD